jgi:selenide,water dikinase
MSQLGPRTTLSPDVPEELRRLAFDPQTSGGLLMAVDAATAEKLVARLRTDSYAAAVIGEVRAGTGLVVEP